MKFTEMNLKGAYLIDIEQIEDNRGYFMRTFCVNEFVKYGLKTSYVQRNQSHSKYMGTIRGMHYQEAPHQETKLVQCINGEIYDVIIDLREDSSTYMQWESIVLSKENKKMLYIPKGFAHGFQSLTDDCDVLYMVDEFYCHSSEKGINFNDKRLNISWPIKENIIVSEKDMAL